MDYYDAGLINSKLRRWETYLHGYSLPKWDELPQIGLYMDQVIELLLAYLNFLPADDERKLVISANAINNYVRLKVMPAPIKRKYYREHIAYLIMICTLKQVLSLSDIKNIIPVDLSGEELKRMYSGYTETHKHTAEWFVSEVHDSAHKILHPEESFSDDDTPEERKGKAVRMNDICFNLIMQISIGAAFSRLLVDKLVGLQKLSLTAQDSKAANNEEAES